MRKRAVILAVLFFSVSAFAGFKVKLVKAKKAEQFQARTTVGSVTYAADLLLDGKDQKDFFYKELIRWTSWPCALPSLTRAKRKCSFPAI